MNPNFIRIFVSLAACIAIHAAAYAQSSPERTCGKAGEAFVGQTIEGVYADAFAVGGLDFVLDLQKTIGLSPAPTDLGISEFKVAIKRIEKTVPLQQLGLQTVCRISGLAEGEIGFRMVDEHKQIRAVKDIPVTFMVRAAGSSTGVEILESEHERAFRNAIAQFEKSLRSPEELAAIEKLKAVKDKEKQKAESDNTQKLLADLNRQDAAVLADQAKREAEIEAAQEHQRKLSALTGRIREMDALIARAEHEKERYVSARGQERRAERSRDYAVRDWDRDIQRFQRRKADAQAQLVQLQQLPSPPSPPPAAPPLPPSPSTQQSTMATVQPPSAFPITDGTYLPTHSRCSSYDIDDDRDARRYIRKGGEELAFRGGSCRRISYGPNSAGIGVVWKCEVEGDPQTIYHTIKPKGGVFEISEWIDQIRGQPRVEIYELCPAVTILRSAEAVAPTARRGSPAALTKQPETRRAETKAPDTNAVSCPFDGMWRVQVEASCTRFRSTAIVENCKIVRGGHLRNASGSIDPSTGAVAYRVAASSDEGTPGGNGTGTLRHDQNGNGRITLGPGCEGSMRWWRE